MKTRIMSYMPENNPVKFALWQGGNNLSNLLDPTSTVPCPFAITLTTELDVQAKSQNEAVRKFATNDKRANSPFGKWVPGLKRPPVSGTGCVSDCLPGSRRWRATV